MSQWDFSDIQMPQMGNWGRSQSATDAIGHLFDLYNGFSQKRDAQKQLANPQQAPTTMGGLSAMQALAGLGKENAQTANFAADTNRTNTDVANTTADRGAFASQFPGQTPATVTAGQDIARTGLQQSEQDERQKMDQATKDYQNKNLDLEGQRVNNEYNLGQENADTNRAYKDEIGKSRADATENNKNEHILAFQQNPGMYDPQSGWTPQGHAALSIMDPEGMAEGRYENPKADTSLLDAFNSQKTGTGGQAVQGPVNTKPTVQGGIGGALQGMEAQSAIRGHLLNLGLKSLSNSIMGTPLDKNGQPVPVSDQLGYSPELMQQLHQQAQSYATPGGGQ